MTVDKTFVRGKSAVVGIAQSVSPTGVLGKTERELEVDMILDALEDAGLSLGEVDGLFCTGMMMPSMDLAEHLGITPRYTDSTMTGGSSFEVHVQHAAAAISLGLCDVAVCVYAATPRARGKGLGDMGAMMSMLNPSSPPPMVEWELPYGMPMPNGAYALAASRHMAKYGTTSKQLAEIAVSTRDWACKNPEARFQEPISVDDVIGSPMISSPLHKLDCCLVTDGAGAFVMTSAERAKDLKKKPVYVLGTGAAHDHSMMISEMPELTVTPGVISGREAFNMAGVSRDDVDILMTYDSFTITVALSIEDLGFCEKGEVGSFVEGGRLGPGGSFPTNTNGGGLSFCHPGMYGMFLIVEAVRQLRGESTGQLDNPTIALAHGTGGVLSCTSTVIFGTEDAL